MATTSCNTFWNENPPIFIAKLSGDYLDLAEKTAFIEAPIEGGALVHYDGLYYLLGSALTGWAPNANKYATAKDLKGPWSEFKDIAPPETKTYGSQSTLLLKIVGTNKTTVIFMGDQWKPKSKLAAVEVPLPKVNVSNAQLWSCALPHLYSAEVALVMNGKVIDKLTEKFGIRTIEFLAACSSATRPCFTKVLQWPFYVRPSEKSAGSVQLKVTAAGLKPVEKTLIVK